MALSTPFDLTKRGYGANAGVVTSLYPHSVNTNESGAKVASVRFSGPDATTTKGAALATSDVFKLISLPAGSVVLALQYKTVTQEGATCTVSIGDSGSATRWASGVNGNTALNAVSTTAQGYTAADAVQLTLATGTAANLVLDISIVYAVTAPLAV